MWLYLLAVFSVCLGVTKVQGVCPHLESSLQRWSDGNTWGGTKPTKNTKVVISGKNILLDESPPSLTGVEIQDGGALIWDNKEGITLTTDHVLVYGKFIIGSEDCKFTKKANIVLTGLTNDSTSVGGYGRKFIGVGSGGTIEIHGEDKLSWTKLARTIPASSQTCGVVYNHQTSPYQTEWGKGLHVMVWNLDGSIYDFNIFLLGESWDKASDELFEQYVDEIQNDKIVAMAVKRGLGLGSEGRDFEKVYSAVERLGGLTSGSSKIRNAADVEAYAFITYKGKPEYTKEQHVGKILSQNYTQTDDTVKIDLWDQGLKFSVQSAVKWQGPWGTPENVDFQVLTTEVAYPKIDVIDGVSSWKPGDKVVFASTDFDWKQAEEKTIYPCTDCNNNQFRVDGAFKYNHFGEIVDGADERGEVALLTRNIVIEGKMEESCYGDSDREKELCGLFKIDTLGGHLKVHRNFSSAHIEGAEFYHMGQQNEIGNYPIHFHMCDDVDGAWVRHNSIHHTFGRCITIHGTDGLNVSDNVCYDHLGHGYFLEDSVEQRNILDGNIGISTKYGALILSDRKRSWCNSTLQNFCDAVSTFWITHPNNYIRNNVAAGSELVGFWFINSDRPLGPSATRQLERGLVTENSTRYIPVTEFYNNVAHSNVKAGLFMDSKISYGQDYHNVYVPETGIIGGNQLDARDPPTLSGERVHSILTRYTGYKNRNQNAWVRAGNILIQNSTFADSIRGLTMAISAGNTAQEVKNSLFIGETLNLGMPETYRNWSYPGANKPQQEFPRSLPSYDPNYALQGYIFYDGPNYVTNCHFKNFKNLFWNDSYEAEWGIPAFRPAGGIGFLRKNAFQSQAQSQVSGASFGFCDVEEGNWVFDGNRSNVDFDELDGDLQATFYDADGSVTGHAGTQVVKDVPFMTSPKCSHRTGWQMYVCPHRYAKMTFYGDGAITDKKGKYPIQVVRDDVSHAPYSIKGNHGLTHLTMLNKTYTVHFNGNAPTTVTVYADNLVKGDFIRLGFCFPKDSTQFEISSWYPYISSKWAPSKQVNSIEELDADQSGRAYYWDSNIGLFFIKLTSNETRTDRRNCPNGKCPNFKINRLDGGVSSDCLTTAYGPYSKQPEAAEPKPDALPCQTKSSQGLGAGPQRTTSYVPPTLVPPKCPSLQPTDVGDVSLKYRGCYKDDWTYRDFSLELVRLFTSMTREICIGRCYRKGYLYAGIQNGNECRCGNSFGQHGKDPVGCDKPCAGNKADMCGGALKNDVFATGIALPPEPSRCDPGSRGILVNQKCYYLVSEERNYMSAQRGCALLGGNLASINSAREQEIITGYLRQGSGDVWFGLNDISKEGTFEFIDGSTTSEFSFFKNGAPSNWWGEEDYGILDSKAMYKWDDRGRDEKRRFLCQLPSTPVSSVIESCGFKNQGVKFGSTGGCYVVVNTGMTREDAEYSCFTRFGVLAPFATQAEKGEVIQQLYQFGIEMDYWVGEKDESSGNFIELVYSRLFKSNNIGQWDSNGAICLLGNHLPCPDGWVAFNDSCYLYTGKVVGSYQRATQLCNGGRSNLVTIETKEENDFVHEFVKKIENGKAQNLYLGYKYSSNHDKFTWIDGSSTGYSNWASGNGLGNLNKGGCARMRSWDTEHAWENTSCDKSWLYIVCKAKMN